VSCSKEADFEKQPPKPLKRQQNSALQLFLLDWEQGKVRSRAVSNGIILDGKDRQNFQHSAFLFSLYRK
jgi:hypothetical protein